VLIGDNGEFSYGAAYASAFVSASVSSAERRVLSARTHLVPLHRERQFPMIVSLGRSTKVAVQFLVQRVCVLPVHWFGRSVLCCGVDCPACSFRSPRLMYYAGVVYKSQRVVVELPSSMADVVDGACRMCNVDNPMGVAVHCERNNPREAWRLLDARRVPAAVDPYTESNVAREVALCMRIATPMATETWREWLERVRITQMPVLRNCVVCA